MRGIENWTKREKVVVGVIVLGLFALMSSYVNEDGSLAAFLVFLAFTLVISGIAALTVRVFRARGDGPVAGANTRRLGLTRAQLAILAGVALVAVYSAVDASRSGTFLTAAFVAEFVLGLVVINLVVLGAVALRRLRHQPE